MLQLPGRLYPGAQEPGDAPPRGLSQRPPGRGAELAQGRLRHFAAHARRQQRPALCRGLRPGAHCGGSGEGRLRRPLAGQCPEHAAAPRRRLWLPGDVPHPRGPGRRPPCLRHKPLHPLAQRRPWHLLCPCCHACRRQHVLLPRVPRLQRQALSAGDSHRLWHPCAAVPHNRRRCRSRCRGCLGPGADARPHRPGLGHGIQLGAGSLPLLLRGCGGGGGAAGPWAAGIYGRRSQGQQRDLARHGAAAAAQKDHPGPPAVCRGPRRRQPRRWGEQWRR
mmetsp:Transcript_40805/g.115409  ORF Transcript_40805/g.115409 Transcript_40805/m.115409 type:complete len:277 (+) Transcript_40805:25-855(+)